MNPVSSLLHAILLGKGKNVTTRPAGVNRLMLMLQGRVEVAPISFPLSTSKADSDYDTQITPSQVRGDKVLRRQMCSLVLVQFSVF